MPVNHTHYRFLDNGADLGLEGRKEIPILRMCVKWTCCPFSVDRLQCLHLGSQWLVGLLTWWWYRGVSVLVSLLEGWVSQKVNSEKNNISLFVRDCSWNWHLWKGSSKEQRENGAAMQSLPRPQPLPPGSLKLGWPFRTVASWGKGTATLSPCVGQLLAVNHLWKEVWF